MKAFFHQRRSDILALALYVLFTFLLTWPMPFQMSTRLAGESNDVFINPWANWWIEKAFREGINPYFTTYLFYPYGVSLTLQSFSPLNTLFWFLLRPFTGTLAAYNATVLLTYPLSGYVMFALVRYLTRSARAGFIAGLIFAFSPYHILESSHPVIGTTQWPPLFLLFFIKTIQVKPRRMRHVTLAVLFLWLTGLSSWHLFAFALGLALAYTIYSLLAERPLWDRRLVVSLAGGGLVCALLLSPLLYPIVREQLFARTPYLSVPVQQGESNDVLSFLLPSQYHPLFGAFAATVSQRFGLAAQRPAYLGLAGIGLALLAFKTRPRSTVFWGLACLLFMLLSVGPYIRVYGYQLNDRPLPWAVPIVSFFRHPFRFNVLISFCLAVLAGWGTISLLQRFSRRTQTLLISSLAAVIAFEYLTIPMPRTKVSVSAFYQSLASRKDDLALAEIPIGRQPDKEYLYDQTIHGKRLVNGVVSRTPPDAYRFVTEIPLLSALQADEPPPWSDRHLLAQPAPLAEKNVQYIVLHPKQMDAERLSEWRDYFAFPPFFEDERLVVYQTRPDSIAVTQLTPDVSLAWAKLRACAPGRRFCGGNSVEHECAPPGRLGNLRETPGPGGKRGSTERLFLAARSSYVRMAHRVIHPGRVCVPG